MKIFILFFILISQDLSAQKATAKSEHINIKAPMFGDYYHRYSFNIDIYKENNNIKVLFFVLDSFHEKDIAQIYLQYMDTLDKSWQNYLNIDSIAMSKNLYKKISLMFNSKNNLEYSNLVDSCFLTDAHQFDNLLPPDYIHMGGVPYRLTFEQNQKIVKSFHAISPSYRDYPFVARLIKTTFSLYKPNGESLLNELNTNKGYPPH